MDCSNGRIEGACPSRRHIYTSLGLYLPLSVALHAHVSIIAPIGRFETAPASLSLWLVFSSPYLLITSVSNTLTLYPIQTSLDGSSPMSPLNSDQEITALRTCRVATI